MERVVYTAPERVDAKTCVKVGEELNDIVKSGAKELVFDMANLKYISSAGLRILLIKEKEMNGGFYITNIPPAVKEILDVTGFSSILQTL